MESRVRTTFDVEGMSCQSCVRHVDQALSKLDGVAAVSVKLREAVVIVDHDPDRASVATLLAAFADEGYPAKPRAA